MSRIGSFAVKAASISIWGGHVQKQERDLSNFGLDIIASDVSWIPVQS
jgi:hypothetical protein